MDVEKSLTVTRPVSMCPGETDQINLFMVKCKLSLLLCFCLYEEFNLKK